MDFNVGNVYAAVFAVDLQLDKAITVKSIDFSLRHRGHRLGHRLHLLAEFRAELLEIGFDALHKDTLVGCHKLQLLDIHLREDKGSHCLDSLALTLGYDRNHERAERLTHFDVDLAAQREHQ